LILSTYTSTNFKLQMAPLWKEHLWKCSCFNLVWHKESIWAPNKPPEVFSILTSNSPRIEFSCIPHTRSSFIPCILSIRNVLFSVLSVCEQIRPAYSEKWIVNMQNVAYFCSLSLYA
jgi:hypothetical protein